MLTIQRIALTLCAYGNARNDDGACHSPKASLRERGIENAEVIYFVWIASVVRLKRALASLLRNDGGKVDCFAHFIRSQ